MKTLRKKKCWVLLRQEKLNEKKYTYVLGVFKKQKQAEEYLAWLNPTTNVDCYKILPSEFFEYKEN